MMICFQVFDSELMAWRQVGSLTGPRRGLALQVGIKDDHDDGDGGDDDGDGDDPNHHPQTIEGGAIVAVGGRHASALPNVDIFDPVQETWTVSFTLHPLRS